MWWKYVGAWSLGTRHIPLPLPVLCQVWSVLLCWLLQIWLEMLYYQHAGARHMSLDYAVCPPYASICTLGGSRVLSHSWLNNCWALWVGRMLQPAPVLTSQSVWETWDSWDWATHSGLMCSVCLLCMWCTLAVVLRHLTEAFAWSFVR